MNRIFGSLQWSIDVKERLVAEYDLYHKSEMRKVSDRQLPFTEWNAEFSDVPELL